MASANQLMCLLLAFLWSPNYFFRSGSVKKKYWLCSPLRQQKNHINIIVSEIFLGDPEQAM
jgi:hypothetical protein